MNNYYNDIINLINSELDKINRYDLFRSALVSISDPFNPLYLQLKSLIGPFHKNPDEIFPEVKSIISYFIPFTKEVTVSPISSPNIAHKWAESYILLNSAFDIINNSLYDYFKSLNYESMGIAGTHTYDPKNLQSMWSHRSAAVISGLGDFGANRLVITDKGSSGRFCTFLTSAKIEPTNTTTKTYCLYKKNGSCLICLDKCPVSALKQDTFDRFNCHDNVLIKNAKLMNDTIGFADACGKCISSCPYAYIN